MKQALDVLSRYGEDVFVFPSEVAAEFWRRKLPDIAGVRSVRVDRIVSWDTFKEVAFPGVEERIPSNSSYRMMFLQSFAEGNAADPVLSSIVPRRYADNSRAFVPYIKSLLPGLKALNEAIARSPGFQDAALASDYRVLYEEYRAFMDRYGLYEPGYEDRSAARLARPATVFFPEVVADFREFEAALADAGNVRIVGIGGVEPPELETYENSFQEIRGLALALGGLLDEGVPADEIAVTFPDLDRYREPLLEQAKLQGVPLRIREGRPLSELPGGRFFALLDAAVSSGSHVDDLKALLESGSYPWKRREGAEAAVRIGLRRCCVGTSGGESLWNRALRDLPGNLRPGREFFRDLEAAARRLSRAKSFRELAAGANAFASEFFDLDAWDPDVLMEYRISLDCLSDLAAKQEGAGIPVSDPLDLWLGTLEEKIYVPKRAEEGIDVYSYRVSAGIRPRHHFIANAGQEETRAVHRPFGFLRDDHKERIGLGDLDMSDWFLRLYCSSGENVRFSSSVESRNGVRLPPGFFVSAGKASRTKDAEAERRLDAVDAERRYWAGAESFVPRCYGYAAEGFRRFVGTGSAAKGLDLTEREAPQDLAALVAGRLRKEGKLRVSSSSLETYSSCPFRFLLERGLRLEEVSYEVEFEDPRFAGERFHEVFALLFKRIGGADGRFRADRSGDYRSWIDPVLDEVFSRIGTGPDLPLPQVLSSLRDSIRDAADSLLGEDARRYDGYEIAGVEKTLTAGREDGTELEGRIDRISGNPRTGGFLLVDYKSGAGVTKSRILGTSKAEPVSYQIPFYVFLAGRAGFPAEEAAYYLVRKNEYVRVLGGEKGWFGAEDFGKVIESLSRAIDSMARGIESGDYRAKPETCRFCPFRAVCRTKYSIR